MSLRSMTLPPPPPILLIISASDGASWQKKVKKFQLHLNRILLLSPFYSAPLFFSHWHLKCCSLIVSEWFNKDDIFRKCFFSIIEFRIVNWWVWEENHIQRCHESKNNFDILLFGFCARFSCTLIMWYLQLSKKNNYILHPPLLPHPLLLDEWTNQ